MSQAVRFRAGTKRRGTDAEGGGRPREPPETACGGTGCHVATVWFLVELTGNAMTPRGELGSEGLGV